MRRSLGLALTVIGLLGLPTAGARASDCIDEAARAAGVNRHVLRAIGWHESRLRSGAVNRNANGSVDVGAFQMNSVHFPRLAAEGVDAAALKDGCTAARVAAAHYRRLVDRHGNTWTAVGAYHSEATPARQRWYARQIAAVLAGWKILPPGALPHEGETLLAPGQAGGPEAGPATAPRAPADGQTVALPRPPALPGHGLPAVRILMPGAVRGPGPQALLVLAQRPAGGTQAPASARAASGTSAGPR